MSIADTGVTSLSFDEPTNTTGYYFGLWAYDGSGNLIGGQNKGSYTNFSKGVELKYLV